MKRRDFLKWAAGGIAVNAGSGAMIRLARGDLQVADTVEPVVGALEALPGKKPLLRRTYRPPNFETPFAYFKEIFTPNDVFFVRYHLADIPRINAQSWQLRIGGEAVSKPLLFTLDDLIKQFEQAEIVAVNQCAGNRRGLVQPHVPGIQWEYGAMGNARWRGVRLKDLLTKAGIKNEALEVVFGGVDSGVLSGVPDFAKSLPLAKALDEHTLIAFEMNGAPLPHWNGSPARLVVPGWTGTYWVKHLNSINVVSEPYNGYWMKTAYRIPKGAFPNLAEFVSQETESTVPITEIVVNSLVTNIESGQKFNLGQWIEMKGIAWDGGRGIERVEVKTANGEQWQRAKLEKDYGRFSWRPWHFRFKAGQKGPISVIIKATNRAGMTQPMQLTPNPGGYHHNLMQIITIHVV